MIRRIYIQVRRRHTALEWLVLAGMVFALGGCCTQTTSNSPTQVAVRQEEVGRWQLVLNQQPYFIKGAGGPGPLAKLKEAKGNSLRTWGTDGLRSILDDAHKREIFDQTGKVGRVEVTLET